MSGCTFPFSTRHNFQKDFQKAGVGIDVDSIPGRRKIFVRAADSNLGRALLQAGQYLRGHTAE